MKKTKIMEAIGNLDDRYVMEFAQPEPVLRVAKVHWLLPVAASLCLLAGALAPGWMNRAQPPVSLEQPVPTVSAPRPTEPTVPSESTAPSSTGATIWGSGASDLEMPKDYGKLGVVSVDSTVIEAMKRVSNPADVLAVYVKDVKAGERAGNQEVYEQVLKPMGATDESFLETGYTFLTEEQILTMKCPENMAINICMKFKAISLTREYVESTDQEFFYVEGAIEQFTEDVKEGHAPYPDYEENLQQRHLMWDFWMERNAQRIQALFDYLGLEDWVVYMSSEDCDTNSEFEEKERIERHGFAGFFDMRFQGTMSREQVMKLLGAMENESFGNVWATETDGFGRGVDY